MTRPTRNKRWLAAALQKQKTRGRDQPAAGKQATKLRLPLAGGESSASHNLGEAYPIEPPFDDKEGGNREPRRPSGQLAETLPGDTRVRFEFARRAHRREIRSEITNKPQVNYCQQKNDVCTEKKRKKEEEFTAEGVEVPRGHR